MALNLALNFNLVKVILIGYDVLFSACYIVICRFQDMTKSCKDFFCMLLFTTIWSITKK